MILDSYAWIEYFCGSRAGKQVNDLVEKGNCYTIECNLAEIYEWALMHREDFSFILSIIASKSRIIPVNRRDWIRGVEIKADMRKKKKNDFGLVDAIVIAKQEELKCKVITGDPHFKGEKNIIFLS
jgi:predicted nucleic acid-binding protein